MKIEIEKEHPDKENTFNKIVGDVLGKHAPTLTYDKKSGDYFFDPNITGPSYLILAALDTMISKKSGMPESGWRADPISKRQCKVSDKLLTRLVELVELGDTKQDTEEMQKSFLLELKAKISKEVKFWSRWIETEGKIIGKLDSCRIRLESLLDRINKIMQITDVELDALINAAVMLDTFDDEEKMMPSMNIITHTEVMAALKAAERTTQSGAATRLSEDTGFIKLIMPNGETRTLIPVANLIGYRSSGKNSGAAHTWFPFEGIVDAQNAMNYWKMGMLNKPNCASSTAWTELKAYLISHLTKASFLRTEGNQGDPPESFVSRFGGVDGVCISLLMGEGIWDGRNMTLEDGDKEAMGKCKSYIVKNHQSTLDLLRPIVLEVKKREEKADIPVDQWH